MSFAVDGTHDPQLESWVESARGHRQFPVQNLPLGIFSQPGGGPRPGTAIGDEILDLAAIAHLLPEAAARALAGATLNALFARPTAVRRALRARLSELLCGKEERDALRAALHPAADSTLHLPAQIGDYTDFYVGIHHAENIGRLLRPDNPLLPNYKWVPIGYHGRASSVRPSGEAVVRPNGQRMAPGDTGPTFGPSTRLDYELELGVWVGQGNALGAPIPIGEAHQHIAGLCLLNDWSARDLQAWEYQPLGPFLAKNFHSTVSPWVITAEALAPFRISQPPRAEGDPAPLPYLADERDSRQGAFAITLEVRLATAKMRAAGMEPVVLSRGPATNMYWTVAQILTHHASNGCNLRPGDLLGTGTISGPERASFGSLMELSAGGTEHIALPTGETRLFLEDGDEVSMAAFATREGAVTIGFGECTGRIVQAPAGSACPG